MTIEHQEMIKLINEYINAIRNARSEADAAHLDELKTAIDDKAELTEYDNPNLISQLHNEAAAKQEEIESRAERDRRRAERFDDEF